MDSKVDLNESDGYLEQRMPSMRFQKTGDKKFEFDETKANREEVIELYQTTFVKDFTQTLDRLVHSTIAKSNS